MANRKFCEGCQTEKSLEDDFYRKPRAEEYPDSKAGFSHECKVCIKDGRSVYVAENKEKLKKVDRKYYLKKRYNLTPEQFNELFMGQNGCCAACERHQSELNRPLCVDHCHTTGMVRGLLCQECNRAFGMLKEDVKTLTNLITYKLKTESAATTLTLKVG